jgi:hypothetical protein
VGSQVQFLVDHCDALLATRRRRIDHARFAFKTDRARVGTIRPAKDLDQGTLSGAVLADQSVDFASADGQIYLMKGTRRAKRFADTFEF